MRIAHIITTLEAGGAEKQLAILVKSQLVNGDSIMIIFLKGRGELREELERLGCQVFSISSPLRAIFTTRKLLKDFGANIVHAHLPRSELLTLFCHGRIPFVITRHNSEPFWPNASHKLSTMVSKLVTFRASGVIAISKGVKNYLINNQEISKRKYIDVCYYGYDSGIFVHQPRSFSSKRPMRFICVSRLTHQKDLHTLLLAFASHRKFHKNSVLTILGEGELKEELEILANNLSLSESITWVNRTLDIENFYLNHDCFVLTSKYEGFGLVLLEAMQFGLPILAAGNSVVSEILSKNHPGLFSIGNFEALASLMNGLYSPENYSLNAIFSSLCLERFTPEVSHSCVKQVYLRALRS